VETDFSFNLFMLCIKLTKSPSTREDDLPTEEDNLEELTALLSSPNPLKSIYVFGL